MSDDDRIGYLSGDDRPLAPADKAELDELRDLLAEPALWAEPPAGLEDRIAAAIAAEVAVRPQPLASPGGFGAPAALPPVAVPPVSAPVSAPPASPTVPLRKAAARRPVLWRVALVAAAAVVAVGIAVGLSGRTKGGERFAMALAPPAGAAVAVSGKANLVRTSSGWRVELDAPGLPRLDGGRFYEAWLRNAAGTLVPIGTFNEGSHVVLWAGVSPRDFPTLTVTEEEADGNQASSGRRVLSGTLALTG